MAQHLPLWRPSATRVRDARITDYLRWLERTRGLTFPDYESLWRWSVEDLEAFWESQWTYFGVRSHCPYRRVLQERVMPHARWFEGATLNYAEHALAWASRPDAARRPALVALSETRARIELTWTQLAAQVAALGGTLDQLGIRPGDRVVSYMPNIPEAAAALLASASRGALWSACSPEMGSLGVLERFRQIEPRVLFAVDGYRYAGKAYDRREVVLGLLRGLPSVEVVILVPYLDAQATLDNSALPPARELRLMTLAAALAQSTAPRFEPVPFDHPLWVVYSSGTTGLPKPIVHGHGGTVIETFKGACLHLDVGEEDRFFWYSSTNWIMWNLLISTLLCGATVVQFDGNPGYPDLGTLWRLAQAERVSFFGTSPAFLNLCMKADLAPGAQFDLSALRTLGATGAPLPEEAYRWVYEKVHPDILLANISGGTDPGTSFVGACPTLPVYAGEIQCRGLGVATAAFNAVGQPVLGEVGELVCTAPIPSLPLRFWGDAGDVRYRESYFDTYPGVWHHGDWLKLLQRPESVTAVIYGRSDATVNRHGVRMGTSEFYGVVERFAEVADSLVIDLEYLGRESCLTLFVVLGRDAGPDRTTLYERLRAALRTDLSARHVPDEIHVIPAVPRTLSGKKMEVPVKRILLGKAIEGSANRASMANPDALDWFLAFACARQGGVGPDDGA